MSLSLQHKIALLPAGRRRQWMAKLELAARQSIVMGIAWWFVGRPEQQAPAGIWRFWLILAGRGWGKLLDVNTPIPTPAGWTKLGDLRIGDQVVDETGRPCRITAVFDGVPEMAYRVQFSDGTYLDACSEHQWVTWTHAERKAYLRSQYEPDPSRFPADWPAWRAQRQSGRYVPAGALSVALALRAEGRSVRSIAAELGVCRQSIAPHLAAGRCVPRRVTAGSTGPQVRTTQELFETQTYGRRGDRNHCIPVAGSLQLPASSLPVDPYVLGAWLGDGTSADGTFTCEEADQPDLIAELDRAGYQPHGCSDPQRVATYGLHRELRRAGVLGNKHVPAVYLRASAEQRLALLQGLMDTDGYCDPNTGKAEFTNTRLCLVDAVVEIARSLGQKPMVAEGRAVLDGRDCGPKWRVTWRPTVPVFRLPRKAAAVRAAGAQSLRNHHRMITDITRIDPVPMRCLTVDSPHSMFLAGEGMIPTHNTRTGAEWVAQKARRYPGARIALVAPTFGDGRDTMVEGDSGLLSVLHPSELRGGTVQKAWNRSLGELFMANGSHFKIFSSEVPRRLRGPQHHFAWGDEPAYWEDVEAGTAKDSTFSNLNFGLRLRGKPGWVGYRPQAVLTTTPRRVPLLKMPDDVVKERPALAGIMQRTDTMVTRGRTMDNIANLDDTYRAAVIDPLVGTTLGLQELEGQMLEDVQGALWTQAELGADRIKREQMPRLNRVEIGFDPSGGTGYGHDEHGIIVAGSAGASSQMHLYILDDRSGRMTVNDAARRAIYAYLEYGAAGIVYEKNQGQDWIPATFKAEWEVLTLGVGADRPLLPEYAGQPMPRMKEVSAYKNKAERATPVAGLYQQHRAHHVGVFPILENQLTTWVPDDNLDSPDRMDALVWVLTHLYDEGTGTADVASSARRESRRRGGRRTGMPSSRIPAVYDPRRSGR